VELPVEIATLFPVSGGKVISHNTIVRPCLSIPGGYPGLWKSTVKCVPITFDIHLQQQ